MKKVLLLISLLALACSCARESEPEVRKPEASGVVEGARVRVNISIPGTESDAGPGTRSLGEGGLLNTLHLAVFGGSGYLKEYAEANLVSSGTYTYETVDADNHPVSKTVPMYNYTVDLVMSDSPRTIHFLGNGPSTLPFGYDTAVMPIQLSAPGEMGYWQTISLPNGIRAKRNANNEFIDINGHVIPEGGTGYIADQATEQAFQGIPLIRNWSKIVVSALENSNFTPVSFTVVNVPARGTMAPYSAATNFLQHYEDLDFTVLESEINYPGNLPSGTAFDTSIPEASAFQAPFGERVADANGGAAYLYERPAPSTNIPPSYVIIYGHYANPDEPDYDGDYYYKVDLMENLRKGDEVIYRYYPIYRNFKYQITINKILAPGQSSPAAAAKSAGSADVSADVSTQGLADISDGEGRLFIDPWMSKTFTREHAAGNPVDILRVWFGTVDGEPFMDYGRVTATLLPADDGGEDLLYNLTVYGASEDAQDKGWRRIVFYNVAPGRTVRTQRIRITGVHADGRLYRDIPITLQPIQPMLVQCGYERVPAVKGTEQSVTISIPDGLVESMFPLDFTIEADNMTLTPDGNVSGNNLPVISGTSISTNPEHYGKTAFQFVRTLTWSDYLSLTRYEDDEEMMWRSFTCYFRTNRDESASDVWVYNEFFEKASDHFTHYFYKRFKDLGFTTPIQQKADVSLPMTFTMTEDPDGIYPADYPYVLIRPNGLRLDLGNGVTAGPDPGTYYIKPSAHTVTLDFMTTTNNPDEIEVSLSANGYENGYVQPYRFSKVGFVNAYGPKTGGSNVVFDHVNQQANKVIKFGYYDHPDRPNVPIIIQSLNRLSISSGTNFPSFPGAGKSWQPNGPSFTAGNQLYHEFELRATAGYQNVSFVLSAPGYIAETITAGRFQGDIRAAVDKNPASVMNTTTLTGTFNDMESGQERAKFQLDASTISARASDYLEFAPGATYTLTVTNLYPNRMDIPYFRLDFSDANHLPASISASTGSVSVYGGNNLQYVWYPDERGVQTVTFTLTPGTNAIRLKRVNFKGFEGHLYMDGQQID